MSDTVALGTLKLKIEDMATRLLLLSNEKQMLVEMCQERDAEIARLRKELDQRKPHLVIP